MSILDNLVPSNGAGEGGDSLSRLIEGLVTALQRFAARVEVEIDRDPPVIVAFAGNGLAFAAGWMSDEGLVVRLRLDAKASDIRSFEPIEGGSLTYEAIVQTPTQLEALEDTLRRSERLTAETRAN